MFQPDYHPSDDYPEDLVAERRASRYRRVGGFCSECHASGGHLPRCPEDDPSDEQSHA